MLKALIHTAQCSQKDEVLFVSAADHAQPLSKPHEWMQQLTQFKRPDGPRFPDGSINWQCPCMAGGSLVAHRCGHHFRRLYICMSENDNEDVTLKCPDEFVNWSACMQNISETRREQMRKALIDENEKVAVSKTQREIIHS